MQDGDLFDECAGGLRIAKYAAAGLHHEGLALVEADVGRCAAQRANDCGRIGSVHDHR